MTQITTIKEIIERCLEPEEIIGATDKSGSIQFLMKWKNAEISLISSRDAAELFPSIVIEFYESKLIWHPEKQ